MKLLDDFLEIFSVRDIPIRFTIGMGELIRQAREESGFSQRELASKIYRRQAALSDMENGKMEPNTSTLVFLSYNLNKPILYFFPEPFKPENNINELSQLEKEILMYAKKLNQSDQIRIIAQLRALAELDNESK